MMARAVAVTLRCRGILGKAHADVKIRSEDSYSLTSETVATYEKKLLTPRAKRIIDQAKRIIDQILREAGVSQGHQPSEATARDGPR